MKKIYRIALALLFAATGLNAQSSEKTVIINTNVGTMKARLYDDVPNHVRTFIARARQGEFNGTLFTRVIKEFSILLLSFVIAAGIQLGKIKVFGVSLGITLVLFVGIILGHFGFTINHNVIHFFKEFGLILFVYSVGMQVGPGFFSSFKKGGITLNMLACGIVFLGVVTAIILHYATGIPMPTMVGILSGESFNRLGILLRSNDKNLVILHQYGIGRYDFNLLVAIVPDT